MATKSSNLPALLPDREALDCAVITSEHVFLTNQQQKDRVWNLFSRYNGTRAAPNYTRESFERAVTTGRMSHGVLIVKYNGDDAAFACLTQFRNWLIVTRYAQLGLSGLPIGSGGLLPLVVRYAESMKLDGVAFTFNEYNLILRDIFAGNKCVKPVRFWRKKYDRYRDHKIFVTAGEIMDRTISIEHPIFFNSTVQYATYIPFKNTVPPFVRHEKQKTTS